MAENRDWRERLLEEFAFVAHRKHYPQATDAQARELWAEAEDGWRHTCRLIAKPFLAAIESELGPLVPVAEVTRWLRSPEAVSATFERLSDDPLDAVAGGRKARSMIAELLARAIESEYTQPPAPEAGESRG